MSDGGIDPCGAERLDPVRPENRPGLSEIAYRIGTQPEFLARMKWRIPRQTVRDPETDADLRPLVPLRARETSDPSIALMDGFAATLDVLSFYSERIANEGFAGTARQRRSMVELARMVGYEPAPGVAASVHLCFTVEASDDPYRSVEVPAGIQAMSVPQAKGQLPQIFETIEPILARAEWNAMAVRTEQDQPLALCVDPGDPDVDGRIYLFDLDNSFGPEVEAEEGFKKVETLGDLDHFFPLSAEVDLAAALQALIDGHALNPEIEPVLRAVPVDEIFLRGTGLAIRVGQRVAAIGVRVDPDATRHVATGLFRVVETSEEADYAVTRLTLVEHGKATKPARRAPKRRAPRFKRLTMPAIRLPFDSATVNSYVRTAIWSGPSLSALVRSQSWSRVKLMHLIRRTPQTAAPETSEAQPGLQLMRDEAGFFGSTATRQETLAIPTGQATPPGYPQSWDAVDSSKGRTIWLGSQGTSLPDNADVLLEREIKEIVPDGWVVVEAPDASFRVFRVASAALVSRSDYAMSGKVTALQFRLPDNTDLQDPDKDEDLKVFRFRTARLHGASQALTLAGTPIREDVEAGADAIDLESLYLDLERGQRISISGVRTDADGLRDSETLTISEVVHIGGHTRLLLDQGPEYSYRRPSVTVNANMAAATHGERYEEVLGSGDATAANQRFKLAKPPLTYVSAETPDGRASTLEIRVDGLLWHEVATLYDAEPDARVYEVRLEDDGTSWVRFGDGVRGRRLPTGLLNVAASYRSGTGVAGEVADEAIIQLKTRPLGIRAVTNPSRSSGSAEAESLAELRHNAPRSVRTLGRIVSLTDYQDFASAFAGIGKARAEPLWIGSRQIVHLTVGAATDTILDPEAAVIVNLRKAADLVRDDSRPLTIAPCQRRFFQLAAKLFTDPDRLGAEVREAALAALLAGFGYEARALAQPVSAAEVIALLQGVPGVVGVDLDMLALIDGAAPVAPAATLAAVLPARPARMLEPAEGEGLAAAELLTLLEAGVTLTVETAHA